MKLTGAQILWESLIREGVTDVFGFPGGATLPVYDAMPGYAIRHILVRHEQGATHMADGYARASGRVGVALATSGPGATNMVTGIATAMMDSSPIVCITGQVGSHLIGRDAFQEIDITGITLPITKHNYQVTRPEDVAPAIHEAMAIAPMGRPGPVLVDITKDAQQGSCEIDWNRIERVDLSSDDDNDPLPAGDWQAAISLINAAERPLILAGHGIMRSGAEAQVLTLAERAQIPVAVTLLGIGSVPASHSLNLGMMGMHGESWVNAAIQQSDLLIALGMRFDDRVTGTVSSYAPHARIIHVDVDPSEIGKNVAVDVPIVGDVGSVLRALIAAVPQVDPADRAEYLGQLAEWRTESEAVPWHGSGGWRQGILTADYVITRLGELTGHDATLVSDVGQHQMWLARYAGFRRPNSHLSSGGLGTMGYGLPAAMGAALGRPDKETWAVVGDGGLQMTTQEMLTVAVEGIPVRVALMDNKRLGMIRQWQEIVYGGNYHSSELPAPKWDLLAEAYGWATFKATTPEEVDGAIRAAQAHDGPALVWFEIHETQNVFPMMPAGKGLSDLIEDWGAPAGQGEDK